MITVSVFHQKLAEISLADIDETLAQLDDNGNSQIAATALLRNETF